ncbi:FAD-binding oxidoreductase [Streptomyces sp. TS71-3]|uniref:FAD-binding oxidoreductase n=1 Tax=Streptomyces sp. TS71-3 TaxID=2733862 RepID=UPI001B22BB15|nr:FAD-binding oxidoreductase [Streptomyces sp. TS71-3]GHJ35699.1 oxidoreductase [Streptomyces sp. TS71-3]
MGTVQLDTLALAALRDAFAGSVITPHDPSYDEERAVFNGMIDRRPAAIAGCRTQQDVARAIRFGRTMGLEIAVRGRGHSVAGTSTVDGGLVVDLSRMDAVVVDPDARTAHVEGGATMADLDRAGEPYGLATTGGRVSSTGVAGLALGGGTGWLDRKHGLACDNLLSVDVMTADGELVRASEDENPELFWALHGGGGNFGVATSLAFRLHPLPSITAAVLLWEPEDGPRVMRAYRDYMAQAPDEAGGAMLFLTAPPEEFVPEHMAGRLVCAMVATYTGPEEEGRRVLAPLLGLGHAGGMVTELPYADLQSMLDDPPGFRNYWSAEYLDALPDEAVDRFCARAADMIVPSPSQHVLFPGGGAAARTGTDFPVPWRTAPWVAHPFGLWSSPADDDRGRQWARQTRADVREWSTGAVYLNFIGDEGTERVRSGFGPDHYARLSAVKAAYDPENVFHRNHNIEPADAEGA